MRLWKRHRAREGQIMTEKAGWEKVLDAEADRNVWRGDVSRSLADIEKALRVLCFLMVGACLFFASWCGFHSKWILDHTEDHPHKDCMTAAHLKPDLMAQNGD